MDWVMETDNSINWDQVLINASISALQGIQETKLGEVGNFVPSLMASRAISIGEELVKQLKNKINNK